MASITVSSTSYIPRRINEKFVEIASFEDGSKESVSVYKIYKGKTGKQLYICDCFGYTRQKNKEDHKHSRIVKFWIEELKEEPGYCFWLDKDENIKYNKFLTMKDKLDELIKLS